MSRWILELQPRRGYYRTLVAIANKNARIAWALLAGYAWLALGAIAALSSPDFAPGRPAWDAALHAWFLGFVFSMVFGHAPIIAPALLRVALPYHVIFYVPLALLHASVALRVAGSLLVLPWLREAAALGHAVAIALFILTMAARALTVPMNRRV